MGSANKLVGNPCRCLVWSLLHYTVVFVGLDKGNSHGTNTWINKLPQSLFNYIRCRKFSIVIN